MSTDGFESLMDVPVVGAPLSGGASTPELAAAVSEAGGFGFLAAGYKTAVEVESAAPGDEIRLGEKVVGRITSAVAGRALGYVRVEVPDEAPLEVAGKAARLR